MKLKKLLKFFITTVIFIGLYATGSAQLIDRTLSNYPTGTTSDVDCLSGSCEITLPAIKLSETKMFTIPLLVSPDNVYTSDETGNYDEVTDNFTISNSGNEVTIQVTDKHASGSSIFSFILHVQKSGLPDDEQQYHVPILRDRAKIALVLDISGSMILNVQGTTETRIDELKYAVNQLIPKLETFKQGGDSLALTYFSSTPIPPEVTYFPKDFILIEDTSPDYNNWSSVRVYYDLDSRIPLQMTALGEGLLDAKNKLILDTEPNVRKMVFLFTDGRQNWGNQLKPDGISFFDTDDSLNNFSTNPKDSIYYFPVATWAAGEQPELFQSIVDANKGKVLFVTPHSELNSWFNNQLVNMLDNGSPQIVMEKSANSISSEMIYKFNLNKNINTLAIELATKADINMRIFKGETDVTSKARVRTSTNYNLIKFDLPIIGNPAIHSEGEWKLVLNGDSEESYYVAVIADDHYSNYDCSVNKSTFTVGDIIHFKTKLDYKGIPITGNGSSVTAVLLKPGDDLGHLLSVYETPDTDSTIIDADSDVNNKFNELLANDTSFFNALLPDEQIINLIDNGNGEYTGEYSNTDLTGIYNIIYLIKGTISDQDTLQRTKTTSSIFVSGHFEEEQPEIINDASSGDPGDQQKYTILKIRPKNKYGYFMGPGFKSKINYNIQFRKNKPLSTHQLKASLSATDNQEAQPYVKDFIDNLDGSYSIILANVPENANPDVTITVRGETIYNSKLHQIPWWFYVIAIVVILLLIILKKAKESNLVKLVRIILWILAIIFFVLYLLHTLGIIKLFFI